MVNVVGGPLRQSKKSIHIPVNLTFTLQCTESAQEVVSVGSGPLHIGTLRIQQIACAEKLALLLTHDGAVYTLPYDTMTPQLVPGKL